MHTVILIYSITDISCFLLAMPKRPPAPCVAMLLMLLYKFSIIRRSCSALFPSQSHRPHLPMDLRSGSYLRP